MGATWLTKGGISNSWEEICSREELGRKSCRWKNLKFLSLVYSTHIKTAQRGGFRWECLQYASTSCFLSIIVWTCSFCPLLGRTRSRGRCWAANRLSHHSEPSGHTIHGEGDGLDIWRQYVRRFDCLRTTHKPQKRPHPICAKRRGNVWHWCRGGWAGHRLFLEGLFQGGG